jgi:trk system potassium uptake protein
MWYNNRICVFKRGLKGHAMRVIIIGVGKLGYRLAESLISSEIDVTVVDSNPKVTKRVREYLDVLVVTGNGIEMDTLKELNMKSYDMLVATTANDETNTIICVLAKKLGCKNTLARIRNPEYSEQLDFITSDLGIDYIVNPELSAANEMSRLLLKNFIFSSSNFAMGKVSVIDCNISFFSEYINQPISNILEREGWLIVAILRNEEMLIPHGETVLLANDYLYIMGSRSIVHKLAENHKLNMNRTVIKKVMILGGGKIGYYLARKLLQENIHVTIIDQDEERCRYLSEKLNNALVIHGNGTDINLLEEENIEEMDAFIGATGYDEQNLLMSLMAKQAGVKKVIAKISKSNYVKIIDKIGVDVALDPTNTTVSVILRHIRGGKVVSVSLLLGGKAEVTEILVNEDSDINGKAIQDVQLPEGIIIGAIARKGAITIPDGTTVIQNKDRLIVFCLTKNMSSLNRLTQSKKRRRFL